MKKGGESGDAIRGRALLKIEKTSTLEQFLRSGRRLQSHKKRSQKEKWAPEKKREEKKIGEGGKLTLTPYAKNPTTSELTTVLREKAQYLK